MHTGRHRYRRLAAFDYRNCGTYFVTICTRNREHLFGEIQDGMMGLSNMGRVVMDCMKQIPNHFPGVTIDTAVAMPDHVHILLHIGDVQSNDGRCVACYAPTNDIADNTYGRLVGPRARSLGSIVRSFKSACTKHINESQGSGGTVWQRNFHEHIVRSEDECDRIRTYILNNPRNWTKS